MHGELGLVEAGGELGVPRDGRVGLVAAAELEQGDGEPRVRLGEPMGIAEPLYDLDELSGELEPSRGDARRAIATASSVIAIERSSDAGE